MTDSDSAGRGTIGQEGVGHGGAVQDVIGQGQGGPFRADPLRGKRILITGGGTGLGKEVARAFVGRGAAVHICGRRQGVFDATAVELTADATHGGLIAAHISDVRDAEQIEAMVRSIWRVARSPGWSTMLPPTSLRLQRRTARVDSRP